MNAHPLVGIVMGSDSDLPTMEEAAEVCRQFGVPYEIRVVSAHRTPLEMAEYGRSARARGLRVLVAGAGGAAHLPALLDRVQAYKDELAEGSREKDRRLQEKLHHTAAEAQRE